MTINKYIFIYRRHLYSKFDLSIASYNDRDYKIDIVEYSNITKLGNSYSDIPMITGSHSKENSCEHDFGTNSCFVFARLILMAYHVEGNHTRIYYIDRDFDFSQLPSEYLPL